MKKIILCADDFGLNMAVSNGIMNLVKKHRISAVSCMVNNPAWQESAKFIRDVSSDIDVGLHFNLTEGMPIGNMSFCCANGELPSINNVLFLTHIGRVDKFEIEKEFSNQLDSFIDSSGQLPDFIDGHQHVHQLPIIREAVINVYKRRFINTKPYIRVPCNTFCSLGVDFKAFLKQYIIMLTGGLRLRKSLQAEKIPHNSSFSGIYDFSISKDYRKYFIKFLSQIEERGIIMCHPGFLSTDHKDVIRKTRRNEYNYFSSNVFVKDCRELKIILD